MPVALATEAGCENSAGGPENLTELTRHGASPIEPDIAAYQAARLAAAMAQADAWVYGYFPAEFDASVHADLVGYACDQAVFVLEEWTDKGASVQSGERYERREKDLYRKSTRGAFVNGTTDGRRAAARTVSIASSSRYSPTRLRGL